MTNTRKLWLIGALALLAACDVYDNEKKGPLEILSAFASTGTASDGGATAVFDGTATAANTYTIAGVGAGTTVFFVKTNKLLDGAKIQTSTTSCAPAPEVNLTVNGAAATGWFTCYYPSTSTATEGASVIIYQGVDILPLKGFFDSAKLSSGFYVIKATITDKQGNAQPVTINSGVAVTVFIDSTTTDITSTSIHLTIDSVGTVHPGATTFDLQRAPNVVDAAGNDTPGAWTTIAPALPLTTTGYDDTGLTPSTSYWYRTILNSGTTDTATSAELEVTTKAP
jgi:hypothetical protein